MRHLIYKHSYLLATILICCVIVRGQSDKPAFPRFEASGDTTIHRKIQVGDRIQPAPPMALFYIKGFIMTDSSKLIAERDSSGHWKIYNAERALELFYKQFIQKDVDSANARERRRAGNPIRVNISFTDTPLTYSHPIRTNYYYFNDNAVLTPSKVPIYITGDTCYYPKGSLKDKVVLGSFGGRYWMKGEEYTLKYSGDTLLQGTKKRHVLIAYSETDFVISFRYMPAYQITHCFNLEYKKPCPWGGEDRCFIFFTDEQGQPFKKSIFIHNVIYL